jgi:hypothetical protein
VDRCDTTAEGEAHDQVEELPAVETDERLRHGTFLLAAGAAGLRYVVSVEEAGVPLQIGSGVRVALGLKRDNEGPICDRWRNSGGLALL